LFFDPFKLTRADDLARSARSLRLLISTRRFFKPVVDPRHGFKTFGAFKRARGPAGPNQQWHHIVEQSMVGRRGFKPEVIHNEANLIRLEITQHRGLIKFYSSKRPFTGGKTVRDWLESKPFYEQYDIGLKLTRQAQKGERLKP